MTDQPAIVWAGQIRVDPERNVARGGRCYPPEHPEVRRQAEAIDRRDHVPPIGVRPLPEKIVRPCGSRVCCSEAMMELSDEPAHTHDLVYGYVRYVAATHVLHREFFRAEQPNVEIVISESISDEEAIERNIEENLVRAKPTDAEFARAMSKMRALTGKDAAEIAHRVGAKSIAEVEEGIAIVDRCPKDVVDEWERNPVKALRIALVRIARIDPGDALPVTERHDKMRAQWRQEVEAFENPARIPALEVQAVGGGANAGRNRKPSAALDEFVRPRPSLVAIERLLGRVDLAREVYDDAAQGYRPITDAERAAIRLALRFAADPRGTIPPVR